MFVAFKNQLYRRIAWDITTWPSLRNIYLCLRISIDDMNVLTLEFFSVRAGRSTFSRMPLDLSSQFDIFCFFTICSSFGDILDRQCISFNRVSGYLGVMRAFD